MEKGILNTNTTNPANHRTKRFFSRLLYYFMPVILFVFLAGHENINPRLGDSYVDFYTAESQHLLEINAKAIVIHSSKDSTSLNFKIQELTRDFYQGLNFSPVWTINFAGTDHLDILIRIADSAEYFGLPREIFNANKLIAKLDLLESNTFGEGKIGERIDLEIEATQTAFRFLIYLNRGIIDEDTSIVFSTFLGQLPEALEYSIQTNKLKEYILSLQPTNLLYRNIINGLPQFLNAYHSVSNPSQALSKAMLSDILFYSNTLNVGGFDSVNTVEKSIKVFQDKYKLESTGLLNTSTVDKMAETLRQQYYLIALNLDRLRKTKINSADYLFVNIPEYKLHVFSNGLEEKTFNVVVGTKKTPTPKLSSKLEKIITNPFWTVPRSITNNEMLSKIRTDSTYLKRHGYYIINGLEEEVDGSMVEWDSEDPLGKKYWIRQNNGGGNALGKIKFVFPNNSRVYMHDTPSKRLFKKKNRAFSHGCVRVQNPEELAQYLSDKYFAPDNDSVNIKLSIAKRKREEFLISRNVEVHLQYLTCSGDEGNRLIFHKDIYKKDKKEIEKLFAMKSAI